MSTGKRQLVEVVAALRSDLKEAVKQGKAAAKADEDGAVYFDVEEIEVELHTLINKSGEANAKGEVEFKILGFEIGKAGAEAKGSYSKENSHTIRLKLKPKRWDKQSQSYKGMDMSDLD